MPPPKIPTRDLFDDTTMTFGEHLEVLRVHLIKALIGLVLGVLIALSFSHHIIRRLQDPVADAMKQVFKAPVAEVTTESAFSQSWNWLTGKQKPAPKPDLPKPDPTAPAVPKYEQVVIHFDLAELGRQLHAWRPEVYPVVPEGTASKEVELPARIPELAKFHSEILEETFEESTRARTDGPDEAFMIYLKVSLVAGLVLSSPWVFYQLWLFVAAGLYPHERHYVHKYLPMSIVLFVGGALFCFFIVIPFVLSFLFSFNVWLDLRPELKISTWINFAAVLCLAFGLSFQLPLVMKFLEQISIFEVKDYREKRRISILVMSIISMVLTPSEPYSMILMLIPLIILYEVGIWLCSGPAKASSPFAPA
jgi:sec-independent protein translocase protein TatC